MARRARRYEADSKLNVKKIIAVIVFILVVIMFIVGIRFLLTSNTESSTGKVETVTYYTIYDNGKWGVINSYGETVIDASYDDMIVVPDSTKAVFVCTYDVNYEDGSYKSKVLNEKGKEIAKGYDKVDTIANYDKTQNIWYESNVLKVQKNGKWGLCDFSGKEILPCEYESIETLKGVKNSLLIVKDGKYGLSDNSGNIIIEPNYSKIEKIEDDYKNGYIVINQEGKYGIIGFDKSVTLECNYEEIKGIYSANYFVVKNNGKYIIIDKEGNTVLENAFDDVIDISGDYIIAKKGEKVGVLDKTGQTKINFEYDEIRGTNTNNFIAKKNEKYGIVNVNGEEKLAFEAIDISHVSTGDFFIADYLENEKLVSKVIDSKFETKITGIVSEINEEKGYLRIFTDDNYKYYNFKFEEKQSSTFLTTNTLFLSKKDGKYGFVDKEGTVVVDYIYDDATEQNASGYAAIKKDGVWGAIDAKGKVIVEPEYNLDNNTKIDFISTWHLCEDTNANYYLDV